MKLAQSAPAYHKGPVAETTDQPISDINAAIDQLQVSLGACQCVYGWEGVSVIVRHG